MDQFSLTELWNNMGLFAKAVVMVMAVMALFSLTIIIERLIVFITSNNESRSFAAKMGQLLSRGEIATAAGQTLGKNIGHLGRVIGAGLTAYRLAPQNNRDVAVESVARAL